MTDRVEESTREAPQNTLGTPSEVSARTSTGVLTGINALGWSAGVAVLTAFATCAGMAREVGRSSALALYSLSHAAIDQRDTYRGMTSIVSAALLTLIPFAIAYLTYRLTEWRLQETAVWKQMIIWTRQSSSVTWIAFVIVIADVAFLNNQIFRLANEAEGIILKHSADAGSIWTEILLDANLGTAFGYMVIFGVGMALFVGLSWWLIDRKIEKRVSRIAFSFWVVAQILSLLLGFSYLGGVVDSIGEFPVVAFSGSQELAVHSCPILLGSDDRQFALLIVNCDPKSEETRKYVLYLPRAEVKWMTAINLVQLQPFSRMDDLKKSSQN